MSLPKLSIKPSILIIVSVSVVIVGTVTWLAHPEDFPAASNPSDVAHPKPELSVASLRLLGVSGAEGLDDIGSVPLPSDDIEPVEIIHSIDASDPSVSQAAWDAGHKKISGLDPQRVIRWRPVLVSPRDLMRGDESDAAPVELLSLSFFSDETVIARRAAYRETPSAGSFSWTGLLDDDEYGKVSMHVAPENSVDDLRAFVHYSARHRDFHVVPTDDGQYYVAVETYRGTPQNID